MSSLDSQSVLQRLKEANVWSKKKLGQHFLIDESALDAIMEAAAIKSDEAVVEIGPGMGVLTKRLLAAAGRVVSFELDPDMVAILRYDLPELELVVGDVLQTAPQTVADLGAYKLVANIPYQITTPILKLFLEGGLANRPTSLTLLVQKEVAERLAAKEGKPGRGYLSVVCQYYAQVSYVRTVPAASFYPEPKVDSAVLHLASLARRALPQDEERAFLRFVKTLFIQPRKQLKNVIGGIRGVEPTEIVEGFKALGFKESVRAQELSLDDWLILYKKYA